MITYDHEQKAILKLEANYLNNDPKSNGHNS